MESITVLETFSQLFSARKVKGGEYCVKVDQFPNNLPILPYTVLETFSQLFPERKVKGGEY